LAIAKTAPWYRIQVGNASSCRMLTGAQPSRRCPDWTVASGPAQVSVVLSRQMVTPARRANQPTITMMTPTMSLPKMGCHS